MTIENLIRKFYPKNSFELWNMNFIINIDTWEPKILFENLLKINCLGIKTKSERYLPFAMAICWNTRLQEQPLFLFVLCYGKWVVSSRVDPNLTCNFSCVNWANKSRIRTRTVSANSPIWPKTLWFTIDDWVAAGHEEEQNHCFGTEWYSYSGNCGILYTLHQKNPLEILADH